MPHEYRRKVSTTPFSMNLSVLRRKSGLTQQQAADLLSVERNTYSGYEHGRRVPNVHTLFDLCKLFDTSPNKMLGWTPESTQATQAIPSTTNSPPP